MLLCGTSACREMVSFQTIGERSPLQSSIAAETLPYEGANAPLKRGTRKIDRRRTAFRCIIESPLMSRLTTRFLRHSFTHVDVADECTHSHRSCVPVLRESLEPEVACDDPFRAIHHHQHAQHHTFLHSVLLLLRFHSVGA